MYRILYPSGIVCGTRLVEMMKKRIISIAILLSLLFGITSYSHELFQKGMVVTTDNAYYRDLSEWQTPYTNWYYLTEQDKQNYIRSFAYIVGDILEVKPPQIIFSDIADDINGRTFLDGTRIELDSKHLNNPYVAFTTIAHEMRHQWQIEYVNYIFNDYIQHNVSYDEYLKQTAEMDANIFSAMVFEMIFPEVVIEVNEYGYMKRIDSEIRYYLN